MQRYNFFVFTQKKHNKKKSTKLQLDTLSKNPWQGLDYPYNAKIQQKNKKNKKF
jgi:hypothetical protein